MDWSCGIGDSEDSVGAIMFPKEAANKLDDVRYDLRGMKATLGAGMFTIAGALTTLAVASIYRTAAGR
jgi:hypothetical protein